MLSTGEVACFGSDFNSAYIKSLLSSGYKIPKKGVLLGSKSGDDMSPFVRMAQQLSALGVPLFATTEIAQHIQQRGYECTDVELAKTSDKYTAAQ